MTKFKVGEVVKNSINDENYTILGFSNTGQECLVRRDTHKGHNGGASGYEFNENGVRIHYNEIKSQNNDLYYVNVTDLIYRNVEEFPIY